MTQIAGPRLADLTTLRLGGAATRLLAPDSTDDLVDAFRDCDTGTESDGGTGPDVLLVGGGSNLVVGDSGWPGTVIRVATRGIDVHTEGAAVQVTVAAGEPWDGLVERSVVEGWSGLAAMSGVPGLVGATPVQNVGAYGTEVADVITALEVYDRQSREVHTWPAERCGFGFRTSALKHTDRYVVLSVTFGLRRSTESAPVRYLELARRLGVEPGQTAPAADVRATVLALRRSKGMLLDAADHDTWSVGSFFVNPFVDPALAPADCPQWQVDGQVKLSAAWLIENAGFHKGFGLDRDGGRVSVSTKHTLALTNRGGASTEDLLRLARVIRDGVTERFGITLRPEARLAGCEL